MGLKQPGPTVSNIISVLFLKKGISYRDPQCKTKSREQERVDLMPAVSFAGACFTTRDCSTRNQICNGYSQ